MADHRNFIVKFASNRVLLNLYIAMIADKYLTSVSKLLIECRVDA